MHKSSDNEGRNEAVHAEGISHVSDDLHANSDSKRRLVAGKQRPTSQDHANIPVKRKSEAEGESQEERKVRKSMLLQEFKRDLSRKAKEDTGGGGEFGRPSPRMKTKVSIVDRMRRSPLGSQERPKVRGEQVRASRYRNVPRSGGEQVRTMRRGNVPRFGGEQVRTMLNGNVPRSGGEQVRTRQLCR